MKKSLLFILFACAPFLMKAQCYVQTQSTPVTCYGSCNGTATAYPGGGTSPYTYVWAPGGQTVQTITGLCPGVYTVTVTDAILCVSTATVAITQPFSPLAVSLNVTPASCQSCCDGNIVPTVSGGTPGYSYMWSPTFQTTSTAQALCPGNYTLCVIDMNGCSLCDTASVNFTTGINDPVSAGNLSVYPSPASQFVTLEETFGNTTNVEVSLINVLGETMYVKYSGSIIKLHETIDLNNLPDGIYFIRIKANSGTVVSKIIKE